MPIPPAPSPSPGVPPALNHARSGSLYPSTGLSTPTSESEFGMPQNAVAGPSTLSNTSTEDPELRPKKRRRVVPADMRKNDKIRSCRRCQREDCPALNDVYERQTPHGPGWALNTSSGALAVHNVVVGYDDRPVARGHNRRLSGRGPRTKQFLVQTVKGRKVAALNSGTVVNRLLWTKHYQSENIILKSPMTGALFSAAASEHRVSPCTEPLSDTGMGGLWPWRSLTPPSVRNRPNRGISITAKCRWVPGRVSNRRTSLPSVVYVRESQKVTYIASKHQETQGRAGNQDALFPSVMARQNSTSGVCIEFSSVLECRDSEQWWEIPSVIGRDSRHILLSSVRICKRGALWGVRVQDAREAQSGEAGANSMREKWSFSVEVDFTLEPQHPPLERTLQAQLKVESKDSEPPCEAAAFQHKFDTATTWALLLHNSWQRSIITAVPAVVGSDLYV
ncbi:hypothetical protein DFP72DRAFT_845529 [Ephemerocybe angulata]|uniref:Uncharacterized protein n=1 Tax=Ephemerocybe angulata TaxID=980116 RepID=A0A8H6I376_9AGAR|nr:hypothetical protein DFP72DRAFT_845529 [Tulosesus angulatus]